LSRELWWTGGPVAVFENENQWKIAEIPGWFSPGDFVLILKNFLLLWERMRFEKYKMFYKTTLHKILLFLQNILSSTYSMHYVGSMLRRRRSSRKKRLSAEAACVRWPKVPLHEASVLQTDLKIE
jgi:hypothetical protein